jgi:hypothetical protein
MRLWSKLFAQRLFEGATEIMFSPLRGLCDKRL